MTIWDKTKEATSSVMWDRDATIIFCNLCLKEIEIGNRPTTHFNKEGWKNITKKFNEMTGRDYDRLKFKNKWDHLKRNWKLWKELKRGYTGLGWDPIKQTIDASQDWWTEKLKALPSAKKFKFIGIDPEFEEKLDGMFSGVVPTGMHAFTPSDAGFGSIPEDLEIEESIGSCEGPSPEQKEVEYRRQLKRPRLEKREKRDAFILNTIKKLQEACKMRSNTSEDSSISDLFHVLDTYPEVKSDKPFYFNSLKVMMDPTRRQMFLEMPPEFRVDYLRSFMNS